VEYWYRGLPVLSLRHTGGVEYWYRGLPVFQLLAALGTVHSGLAVLVGTSEATASAGMIHPGLGLLVGTSEATAAGQVVPAGRPRYDDLWITLGEVRKTTVGQRMYPARPWRPRR